MSNLELWNAVSKTNTSHLKQGQQGLSSIDSYSMFKAATEAFGVCGIGWGYEVLEESYIEGPDIVNSNEKIAKFTIGQVIGKEINHIIKLRLWFKIGEQLGEVFQYGITRSCYASKWGLTTDEEAPKKSLTDAIKKCLSMLGFSADVYMGKFEDANYRAGAEIRSQIEESDEREEEQLNQINKLNDYYSAQIEAASKVANDIAYKTLMTKLYKAIQARGKAAAINPQTYLDQITSLVQARTQKQEQTT